MTERKLDGTTHVVLGNQKLQPQMQILVCDDDPIFLEQLLEKMRGFFISQNMRPVIHAFQKTEIISKSILKSCDIALLDIDLANQQSNGMDIARRLREVRKDAIIIFITNFIEYAPEGYEVQAFRYILKRDVDTSLLPYMQQALEQMRIFRKMLKIRVSGEIIPVPLEDIMYLEVQQHHVTVHLQAQNCAKDTNTYRFYGSLSDLEEDLEPQGFLRIHKCYLVNMRHIKKFQCHGALLDDGVLLRVSEKKYAEQKKKYLLWKSWK